MIYRRPSLSRERFVFSVVAAGTGAILVGTACGDTMVPSSAADVEDASEDFQSFAPDVSTSNSCTGLCGTSSTSGTSASSSGCQNGSSSGCDLIVYDATSDAIENLDTGSDQEAAASDGSSDGSNDGAPEAGDAAAETGDP